MSIENLDDYLLEFQKYKEGNYKFGNYRSEEEVFQEFLKGKIFVLKGGLKVGDWILMIIFCTIVLVSLFALLLSNIVIFILPLIFTVPFIPILLLKPRHFVVIGPLGVYYQKIMKKGSFSWNNVSKVDWDSVTYPSLFITKTVVKVHFPYQRKEAFSSQWYLNKEFPKKVRRRMFINLFYFYFKFGKNKILFELKEKLLVGNKVREIAQKQIKTLEERIKIDEEYKTLLERRNSGESVEDLIRENRNYAEVLAKKDKDNIEESKKWRQSEEGKIWIEEVEKMLRMDPDFARISKMKLEKDLKIANEIKRNEEEYESLLEKRNKGEYVDDLIKQNRYTAKLLAEQHKKTLDETLDETYL